MSLDAYHPSHAPDGREDRLQSHTARVQTGTQTTVSHQTQRKRGNITKQFRPFIQVSKNKRGTAVAACGLALLELDFNFCIENRVEKPDRLLKGLSYNILIRTPTTMVSPALRKTLRLFKI